MDLKRSRLQAACCIVSHKANEDFDAYVLSESSLFVYPERLTLKTCGTTQLLAAVPLLVELAESLDMCACRTKYSRASFLFPEKQVGSRSRCHPSMHATAVGRLCALRLHKSSANCVSICTSMCM